VGIAILVAVSVFAALGLKLLPENRAWLLGLVPLGLGVYKLLPSLRARKSGAVSSPAIATGLGGDRRHDRQRRRQHRRVHAGLPNERA
jgi:cadmium resistance protein CadD (predicted permease)